ncbi:ATP-binding protein [Nonomuraea sp. 3-1Str]|uniref:ATP-binding protein n=1 Tax=Nonomuraea sp. 3-1Str TaxID=2929801 RepID=UPI002857EDC3|nr:ATP-binding protein [Nonomuraea sp. 3-1Str]MDR8409889.1 ATP-binding protein [Nonomuraea sp. 3-1Str]
MNVHSWVSLIAALGGNTAVDSRVASWRLPPHPHQVGRARRLVRKKLTQWGFADQADVAELLISELVSNALEHAHGPIGVSLSESDGLLRFEVEDSNPDLPDVQLSRRHDERGRGLQLVDMLACCWGRDHTPRGKVVWFELPVSAQAEHAPAGTACAGTVRRAAHGHAQRLAAIIAEPS